MEGVGFPHKFIIVGVEGGYPNLFKGQSYSNAKFQNPGTAPFLGEFGWGFLFFLSPRENKVNYQVWPGMGV